MTNSISVVMTSYNGEKFIDAQIKSVLMSLKSNDELIILDDGSDDNSLKIIESHLKNDERIKLIKSKHIGQSKNTEIGINISKNEIILLCDQDDVWELDKRDIILKKFTDNIDILHHDASLIDGENKNIEGSLYFYFHPKTSKMSNFYKSSVFGCCLAVRKSFAINTFPIPSKICHDIWFALICKKNKLVFIEDKLIKCRRHENNQSGFFKRRNMIQVVKSRIYLFVKLLFRRRK